jgi:hypothetical protein
MHALHRLVVDMLLGTNVARPQHHRHPFGLGGRRLISGLFPAEEHIPVLKPNGDDRTKAPISKKKRRSPASSRGEISLVEPHN